MAVVFLPDFSEGNPYQRNLAAALADNDIEVVMGTDGGLVPIVRSIPVDTEISIIHFHWFQPYITGPGRLVTVLKILITSVQLLYLRLRGIHIMWTAHNVVSHEAKYPRLELAFKRGIIRVGICSRVFVHCDAAKDDLLDELNLPRKYRERIIEIRHGHYLDNYENYVSPSVARESLNIDEDGTSYLYFGNIRPYKGLSDLIEAFRAIRSPSDELLLVGNPNPNRIRHDLLRETNDDEQIRLFFGFIPNELVQLFMNAVDVVVLPFDEITTSGSAILAMSFGKPLVLPRRGCIPELIDEEGAILYQPDADGLSPALEQASAADLNAMGEHNYKLVSSYTWEEAASETTQCYREYGEQNS